MQPHSPLAGQPAPLSHDFFEFLAVRAGEQWFAVDVQAAVEIRGPETFSRAGGKGRPTLTVREEALRVVDLRRLSGLSAFESACPAMLLVQASAEVLALAVDEVGEIESVPRERVRAVNPLGFVFCSQSIAMPDNGQIPLIDPVLLIAA
ncbi:chemotaxis protein CheW [Stenotrophomonas sp. SAU14A_NAIMI4_8]|uniref:chemotaxis protein CheW n=1 Tax=Stenotrophomonas sp. SAU14A_NAIMI4_8 TaxID=2072409 RepID=UPI000D53CE6D|nr:chemotaxis protein CheW [Stenotrophomonas sp. SAU14A_NAIMI4_8]AWH32967.1 chemotaxis protein CheW [Stenotrophomonas sp. SAU14A_NAIMI4_8]